MPPRLVAAAPNRGCSCPAGLPSAGRAGRVLRFARPQRPRLPRARPAAANAGLKDSSRRRCIRAQNGPEAGHARPRASACPSWGTTLRAAVQPSLRKRRQIPQTPRPERPLVYEKLSDAILVKRAKDGDKRALSALCERHAPKVERLAGHLVSDPEDALDFSFAEISAAVDMPIGTAKCYAHRARAGLRTRLKRDVA